MIDGGGFGQSGPTFQGGMYGGLLGSILNRAGVRPMGYQERLGSVTPQMRPSMPTSPAAAAYTAPAAPAGMPAYTMPGAMGMPFQRQPVVTPPVYSYPLDDPFGSMMARLQLQGIPQQGIPAPTGYGAR